MKLTMTGIAPKVATQVPLLLFLLKVVTIVNIVEATDNIFTFSKSLKNQVSPEKMNKFRNALGIKDGYEFDESNYVEVIEAPEDTTLTVEMDKIVTLGNLEFNLKDSALTNMGSIYSPNSICLIAGVATPCPMLSPTRYMTYAIDSVTNQMYDIRVNKDASDTSVIDSILVKEVGASGINPNNFAAIEDLTYNLRHVEGRVYINVPNDAIDYGRFTEYFDGEDEDADSSNSTPASRRNLLRRQGQFHNAMNNFNAKINVEKVAKVWYDDGNNARNPHRRRRLPAEACTECYELRVGIVSETGYCNRFGGGSAVATQAHLEAYVADISVFYEVDDICTDLVLSFSEVYCDGATDLPAGTQPDPFAAAPTQLPIANSGCSGDGAIDSIAEYMAGGTFGGVAYPSKLTEDWDVVSIFADFFTNSASGCASRPGIYSSNLLGFRSVSVPTHEWGHNMGCRHTVEFDADCPDTPTDCVDADGNPTNDLDFTCIMRGGGTGGSDTRFCDTCRALINARIHGDTACNRNNGEAGPTTCDVSCPGDSDAPTVSLVPSTSPSSQPSSGPSTTPSLSMVPSASPSSQPSGSPSNQPSISNSPSSSSEPPSASAEPSNPPSNSLMPSNSPSLSSAPSNQPSALPTVSIAPSSSPSSQPSGSPSSQPSESPSSQPSELPSVPPSMSPSAPPSVSHEPSIMPSESPSMSSMPSSTPSVPPSLSQIPSNFPSEVPTVSSMPSVSNVPTTSATDAPTLSLEPSASPSIVPSESPSSSPSQSPSSSPSQSPSSSPSRSPSSTPSTSPTVSPSGLPSAGPSMSPSVSPSTSPSEAPSVSHSPSTSAAPSVTPNCAAVPENYVCRYDRYDENVVTRVAICVERREIDRDGGSTIEFRNRCVYVEDALDWDIGTVIRQRDDETDTLISCGCCDRGTLETDYVGQVLPDDIDIHDEDEEYCLLADATDEPTTSPSVAPSRTPSALPSLSQAPSRIPTNVPTTSPSQSPSSLPSGEPSLSQVPSRAPSDEPTTSPSSEPTTEPTMGPSLGPTTTPSESPSSHPSVQPSLSQAPSRNPTGEPTTSPSMGPTAGPSLSDFS